MQETNCHIRKTRLTAALFITVLDDFITECGCSDMEFTELQNALDSYRNCENIDQLKKLITDTYISALERFGKNTESGKTHLISDIQDYIGQHYMDPELRLETIAAHFFVSPQYLSTLFSQESHSTLSSYINTSECTGPRNSAAAVSFHTEYSGTVWFYGCRVFQQVF